MPDSRLPGLATVAVLMFVGMLAAAITVTGPIPVPYEVAKDFQPLIAALVAIISAGIVLYGATLAYRASHSIEKSTRKRFGDDSAACCSGHDLTHLQ